MQTSHEVAPSGIDSEDRMAAGPLSPVGAELRKHAHEISLELDAGLDDLMPLRGIVGDARVVVLGESVHGVPAFWNLRQRILRYLAAELGFSGFVTESGFPEGASGEAGIPQSLKVDPGIPGVRHYGMDLAGSAASYRHAGLSLALDFLDTVDTQAAAGLRHRFDPLLATLGDGALNLAAFLDAPRAERDELTAALADVVALLSSESHRYAAMSSHHELQTALRAAVNARQADDQIRAAAAGRAPVRDAAMAENVQWVLSREQRILVHAHNLHIQRWPQTLFGGPPMTTLGQYLADALDPSDIVVIGTTFTTGRMQAVSGPPGDVIAKVVAGEMTVEDLIAATPQEEIGPPPDGTADAVFAQAVLPAFLVDLRQLPVTGDLAVALDRARSHRTNNLVLEAPVRTAFDAILHVDRIEQRRPNAEEMAQALKAAQGAFA